MWNQGSFRSGYRSLAAARPPARSLTRHPRYATHLRELGVVRHERSHITTTKNNDTLRLGRHLRRQ